MNYSKVNRFSDKFKPFKKRWRSLPHKRNWLISINRKSIDKHNQRSFGLETNYERWTADSVVLNVKEHHLYLSNHIYLSLFDIKDVHNRIIIVAIGFACSNSHSDEAQLFVCHSNLTLLIIIQVDTSIQLEGLKIWVEKFKFVLCLISLSTHLNYITRSG